MAKKNSVKVPPAAPAPTGSRIYLRMAVEIPPGMVISAGKIAKLANQVMALGHEYVANSSQRLPDFEHVAYNSLLFGELKPAQLGQDPPRERTGETHG